MVVELVIFSSQKCELEVWWYLIVGDNNAPLNCKLADDLVVVGVDGAYDIGAEILEALDPGEVVFVADQDANDGSDGQEAKKEKAI